MAESDGSVKYEVRADTSHLTADLNAANQLVQQSAQQTQRKINEIGKNAESALEPMTDVIEDAAESIDDLGDSAEEAAKDVDRLGDTEQETKEQTKGLGDEAEKASKKIKEHGEQSKKSAEHTEKLKDSTDKLKTSLKDAGKTIGTYAAAAGAAFTAIGTAAIKSASDAVTSFAKVRTLLSDKIMVDDYYSSIKNASANTGVDFGSMAESVYSAISASVDEDKAVDFVQNAVKLAKGGFTETATAVDVLTTAINAYGLAAEDATHISDVLITTQNAGKTTVDELANSMGPIIPIAKNAGESIEGLCTELAIMTKNGNDTAESVTMLKSMFSELSSTGSNVDKTLREISGKSFAELKSEGQTTADVLNTLSDYAASSGKTLKDLFGSIEAGTAALSLVSDGGADFANILDQMSNSAGAAEKAYETMANTIEERVNKLKNKFTLQFTEIGEKLLPQIEKFADYIDDHFDEISDTIEDIGKATEKALEFLAGLTKTLWEHKEVVAAVVMGYVTFKTSMAIGGVIASTVNAVKSLTSALKAGATAQEALNVACKANPYVLLASAIIGVVSVIGTFVLSNKEAAESVEDVSNKVSELSASSKEYKESADKLEKIANKYDDIYNSEKTTAEKTEELKLIQDELVTQYGDLAGGIDIVNGKFDEQIQKLKDLSAEERNRAAVNAKTAYMQAMKEQDEYVLSISGGDKNFDPEAYGEWFYLGNELHAGYTRTDGIKNVLFSGDYDKLYSMLGDYYNYLTQEMGYDEKDPFVANVVKAWDEVEKKIKEINDLKKDYYSFAGEDAFDQVKAGATLSEDQMQALINLYPVFKDKMTETDDGYVVEAKNLTLALKELEAKQKAAAEAAKENADATSKEGTAAEETAKEIKSLVDQYGDLYSALENVKNGGAMSFEQMQELIKLFPELADKIELTADGYIIESNALADLETALDDSVDAQIQAEREKTRAAIDGAKERIAVYRREIEALHKDKNYEEAQKKTAELNKAEKELDEKQAYLDTLDASGSVSKYLKGNRGKSGSTGGGSGSSGGGASDPNETAYDKEYATLKYRYDMGEIDDATFYSGVGQLRDKYLEADSDKWRAANVSIHNWEESQKKSGSSGNSASNGKSGTNISITSYIPTLFDDEDEVDRKLQQALGVELAGNSSYGHIMSGVERSAAVAQMSAVSTSGAVTTKEATLNDVVSAINELQKADENRQLSFDVVLKARDLVVGRVAIADINDITKIDGKTPLIIK